jgi:uncharacterized membrane protein
MSRLFILALSCLVAVYPLIVLFGLEVVPVYYLGLFFVVLAVLRLWFLRASIGVQVLPVILCAILILVALYVVFSGQPVWFRFYPVAVNATLLGMFLLSLWRGPTIVERMARISNPQLPAVVIPYTRKVTILWCCFFLGNGLAAFYTAQWASFEIWGWYNGAVAYCLMGAVFVGEWFVRRHVQRNTNVQA